MENVFNKTECMNYQLNVKDNQTDCFNITWCTFITSWRFKVTSYSSIDLTTFALRLHCVNFELLSITILYLCENNYIFPFLTQKLKLNYRHTIDVRLRTSTSLYQRKYCEHPGNIANIRGPPSWPILPIFIRITNEVWRHYYFLSWGEGVQHVHRLR
jgi:hypothetical protein